MNDMLIQVLRSQDIAIQEIEKLRFFIIGLKMADASDITAPEAAVVSAWGEAVQAFRMVQDIIKQQKEVTTKEEEGDETESPETPE